jgi:hypothetical protein
MLDIKLFWPQPAAIDHTIMRNRVGFFTAVTAWSALLLLMGSAPSYAAEPALDALAVCGRASEELSQEQKGNLEGKAQTIARLGTAELQGAAANAKKEIEIRENRTDAERELHYLNHLSCVLIYQDAHWSTDEKLQRINVLRDALKPSSGSPATAPRSELLDYRGPPLWTTAGKIAAEYPSGRWIESPDGARQFFYETEFHGYQTALMFFLPKGGIEFRAVTLTIFSAFGNFTTNLPNNSPFYPAPGSKFGSREEVSALCANVFDSVLETLSEKIGPVLDKPIVQDQDTWTPDGCQATNNCFQHVQYSSIDVKFRVLRNVTLRKGRSYISSNINNDNGYRTFSENGNCMVVVASDDPASLKLSSVQ